MSCNFLSTVEREKGFYYAIREGELVIAEWTGDNWWSRADILCNADFDDIGYKIDLKQPVERYKKMRLSEMDPGQQFVFNWYGSDSLMNIVYCLLRNTETTHKFVYYVVSEHNKFALYQMTQDDEVILIEDGKPYRCV